MDHAESPGLRPGWVALAALRDWAGLTRLPNALVAGFGVWLGHACLPGPVDTRAAWLGSAAMALLAAAGNVQNDVLDLEADRINRPGRAIPAGRVSPAAARRAFFVLYAAALSAGAALGPAGMGLAAGMAALLWLYNLNLKSRPLWGNLAVATLCALAVYFPEFPSAPSATAMPAAFALITTLAREIAKDAEDMPGDLACGWKTFPIRFGEKAAAGLVAALIAAVLLLMPVPVTTLGRISHFHGAAYGIVAALGPLPLLLAILGRLAAPARNWKSIQKLLKGSMFAGMAAILAGAYA